MKKFFAALTTAALAATLTSCGSSSSKKEGDDPTGKTIGISLPNENLDRWNSDGKFLKEKFEEAGYKVVLKYASGDVTRQNNDLVSMITDKVDLLLVAAVDGQALANTLDSAKEADIPIVAYDRLINDTDAITYYVSFDNYGVGKLQANFIKDQLKLDSADKPYTIEFVSGDSSDPNAKFFFDGAYSTLASYIDSGKLNVLSDRKTFELTATKDWLSDNAKADMKKLLDANYPAGTNIDAVLCSNDSTALGVTQALDENYKGSNVPIITGQDGDDANLKNIIDGKQAMTVYKNLHDEASVTFEVCKTILSGKTPAAALASELPYEVAFDSETYNNGVKYVQSYILTPYVITKDNMQLLVNTGMFRWDSSQKYVESVTGTNAVPATEAASEANS